jgi:hypothetical protein
MKKIYEIWNIEIYEKLLDSEAKNIKIICGSRKI